MLKRILISGAAGSGTTSLGQNLAKVLSFSHFDCDDFYWIITDPPYQTKRSPEQRTELLNEAIRNSPRWILSGSIDNWNLQCLPCDFVIFLTASAETRVSRLRARELARFGDRVLSPDGDLHQQHLRFLEWAAQYDQGSLPGRSRSRHEAWLRSLTIPVVRLNGEEPLSKLTEKIVHHAKMTG